MDDKDLLLLEQWKMAAELHRNEDRLMWQRFGYFVTLTGILISGGGFVLTSEIIKPDEEDLFLKGLSLFGFSVTWAFASILRRSHLYHNHRIVQAAAAEVELANDLAERPRVYGEGGVDKKPKEEWLLIWCIFSGWQTGGAVFFLVFFVWIGWGYTLFRLFFG